MAKRNHLVHQKDLLNFEPLMDLRQSMDHLFDDFFSHSQTKSLVPKCNIYEKPDSYHIEVQAPGMSEEDLDISLTNNVLTIKGEVKKESKENIDKEKNYHKIEFSGSSINRSWELPASVDVDHLTAKFNNGILEVILPKMHKKQACKKVKITKH